MDATYYSISRFHYASKALRRWICVTMLEDGPMLCRSTVCWRGTGGVIQDLCMYSESMGRHVLSRSVCSTVPLSSALFLLLTCATSSPTRALGMHCDLETVADLVVAYAGSQDGLAAAVGLAAGLIWPSQGVPDSMTAVGRLTLSRVHEDV